MIRVLNECHVKLSEIRHEYRTHTALVLGLKIKMDCVGSCHSVNLKVSPTSKSKSAEWIHEGG